MIVCAEAVVVAILGLESDMFDKRMTPDEFRSTMLKKQRLTRELIVTLGDSGSVPVTKLSGIPWWPHGTQRPKCNKGHLMSFVAQILLSDIPILSEYGQMLLSFHYCQECAWLGNMAWGWTMPEVSGYDLSILRIDSTKSDDRGEVAEQMVKPYSVSFHNVYEVPSIEDVGMGYDKCPNDYPQGKDDFDENIYPGLVHVMRSKIGGWPSWQQDPEWPPFAIDDEQIHFVGQLDCALCDEATWAGGGYAYLFVREHLGKLTKAELLIQTT
jgi:hypothetical protein